MTVNIVEILDLYLKNGGRRPYIIIVLNSCFIPKTFRTFPGFFPIFHRYNKNQDFFRTGNGFYEIPDFFPFSRLRGNPVYMSKLWSGKIWTDGPTNEKTNARKHIHPSTIMIMSHSLKAGLT